MRKKETAVWFYPEIYEIDDVDAQQYHRASFSTRNSALNTSLRKPIRMQDFIQLCDSIFNKRLKVSLIFWFGAVLWEIWFQDKGCTGIRSSESPIMTLVFIRSAWGIITLVYPCFQKSTAHYASIRNRSLDAAILHRIICGIITPDFAAY